jgi:hypothetical protein
MPEDRNLETIFSSDMSNEMSLSLGTVTLKRQKEDGMASWQDQS